MEDFVLAMLGMALVVALLIGAAYFLFHILDKWIK